MKKLKIYKNDELYYLKGRDEYKYIAIDLDKRVAVYTDIPYQLDSFWDSEFDSNFDYVSRDQLQNSKKYLSSKWNKSLRKLDFIDASREKKRPNLSEIKYKFRLLEANEKMARMKNDVKFKDAKLSRYKSRIHELVVAATKKNATIKRLINEKEIKTRYMQKAIINIEKAIGNDSLNSTQIARLAYEEAFKQLSKDGVA